MVIIMVRILMRIFQVLEPPQSEDGDDSATGGLSGDYDYDDNGDFLPEPPQRRIAGHRQRGC